MNDPNASQKAIAAKYALVDERGSPRVASDVYIHISGNTIDAVNKDKPSQHVEVVDYGDALVVPGFINLHNHCANGPMFRGLRDDAPFEKPVINRLIYDLLQPMSLAALESLDAQDIAAFTSLGLLDVLKGGSTTILDQFPAPQPDWFRCAEELGVRGYAAPSVMSAKTEMKGAEVEYHFKADDPELVRSFRTAFKDHNGAAGDRLRVIASAHAPDTCSPELLVALAKAAEELGCPMTIHLSQSQEEVEVIRRRHGCTPVQLLHRLGVLGPNLIAAHCVVLDDLDYRLLKENDVTVVNCPVSFAWAGQAVTYARTLQRGIRTCFGTDSHGIAIIDEMRLAAWLSKIEVGSPSSATSYDLMRSATGMAGVALGRPDLGGLAPGRKADMLVVSMRQPHLQPVWDPIKNLIWKSHGADYAAIIVDGRVVVENGRSTMIDENGLIERVRDAAARFWGFAERAGKMEPATRTRGALTAFH